MSFSACCTCFTWLSAEADALDDCMDVLACVELAVELAEAEVEGWLAANAAVMDIASAVRASFLIMVKSFPLLEARRQSFLPAAVFACAGAHQCACTDTVAMPVP